MKEKTINHLSIGLNYLFILFWAYSFFSKVLFFSVWHGQMQNQVFNPVISEVLQYLLPAIFLLLVLLLASKKTIAYGLYLSFALLAAFNIYILLVWLNWFDRIPCSCAAMFPGLSWLQQFILNCIALLLLGYTIFIYQKERRWAKA